MSVHEVPAFVRNRELVRWVADCVALCKPAEVHWCDGSQQEYDRLCGEMVAAGTLGKKSGQGFYRWVDGKRA